MELTFRNTTAKDVLLTFGESKHYIKPAQEIAFEIGTDTADFSLEPCCESRIRYISKTVGIINYRHFKLKADYRATIDGDSDIQLISDVKKGKFRDEYERVLPFSNDCSFDEPHYSIRDEELVRRRFREIRSNSNRTLLIWDILDFLGNSLQALLLLIIPFVLIWIFGSFILAAKICGCIFAVVCIILLFINRLIGELKRKIWKKGKAFVLRKQIFKDYNSYFEDEYIKSVFPEKNEQITTQLTVPNQEATATTK